mmetsp:Transcript_4284/g.8620  ORF Transcript_4284/g.8620 Transcript_4284/m.8620 type:complete len:86 (+) Transcript_4284:333-590(+)
MYLSYDVQLFRIHVICNKVRINMFTVYSMNMYIGSKGVFHSFIKIFYKYFYSYLTTKNNTDRKKSVIFIFFINTFDRKCYFLYFI